MSGQVAFRATNNKLVCRYGTEGGLRAAFSPSRQGWLQRNQEVFEVEWHTCDHGRPGVGRARSNSNPQLHGHDQLHHLQQRQPLPPPVDDFALTSSHEIGISHFFALRADNGRYWRVTEPDGILVATGYDGASFNDDLDDGKENLEEQREIDKHQMSRTRPDEELFAIEVQHANVFAIRSKATGTYVEVREDGFLVCNRSSPFQLAIKESQLFQLSIKVIYTTFCFLAWGKK